MNKWIIGLIAIAAVVAIVIWQRGSTKTAYVNGLPEYTNLPNREYIFERDCYIFKLKKRDTSYPLVGANAPDLAAYVPELPKEVRADFVGKELAGIRILDLVKAGSRFKIISVRREQTRENTTITFEVLMIDEADRRYPRLDAYYILDHSPESHGAAPKIIDGYAAERVKK